jgi:hypothetical protein
VMQAPGPALGMDDAHAGRAIPALNQ